MATLLVAALGVLVITPLSGMAAAKPLAPADAAALVTMDLLTLRDPLHKLVRHHAGRAGARR